MHYIVKFSDHCPFGFGSIKSAEILPSFAYTPFHMVLSPYQIVVPLLSLTAVLYAWSLMMRKKKTIWEVILWTIFWGAIAYIAFKPNTLSYLTLVTGIKNQESAILVTAIGILFFIVFYLIIRIEELQQRQTRLVRSMALRDAGVSEKSPNA
jgi:hypothetical protein